MQELLKKGNKKVLLHTCCAICSGYPVKFLKDVGWEPIAYFFNPNISPEIEYIKRLEAQKKLCENLDCELIIEDYAPKMFEIVSFGLEDEPEKGKRCEKCFQLRLSQTAKKAKELDIRNFTTSIVISPHKNFKLISEIGNTVSQLYNTNYLAFDFKKQAGTLKSNEIAQKFGLYRQDYCGCQYSKM